jgi:hypothetical protein
VYNVYGGIIMFSEETATGCCPDAADAAQILYGMENYIPDIKPKQKHNPDKGRKCVSKFMQQKRIYRVQTR